MRELILECARRMKKDTAMKRAFLKAVGVDVPMDNRVTIHVDESRDIMECFENRQRVRL